MTKNNDYHRQYAKPEQSGVPDNFAAPVPEDTLQQSKTAQQLTLRARKYSRVTSNSNDKTNTDLLTFGLEDKYSPENERKLGHKVYRLKGYTTVDKVKRKHQQQKHQRSLRNLLTTLMIIIVLIILFVLYNPFKDSAEWKKITGMDSFLDETETSQVIPDDGLPDLRP